MNMEKRQIQYDWNSLPHKNMYAICIKISQNDNVK